MNRSIHAGAAVSGLWFAACLVVACANPGSERGGFASIAVSDGGVGGYCTPDPAYGFVYPVAGPTAVSSGFNTIDPREDGWFVQNCYAAYCAPPDCGNSAPDVYHPGEDLNFAPWGSDGRRACANRFADVGRPVYAIANGVVRNVVHVRVRRSDGTYSDRFWAVVIQHILPAPVDVAPYLPDGASVPATERMVSEIYSLSLHIDGVTVAVGDCVHVGQQIGYIADMASGPHLHFEIDRPSPRYLAVLSRGGIGGTRDGYYPSMQVLADNGHLHPSHFIRDHRLTWHPPGTAILADRYYLLAEDGGRLVRRPIPADVFAAGRYDRGLAIQVSPGEADCYDISAAVEAPPAYVLYRTTDSPTVYRVDTSARVRQPFISAETFASWGYRFPEVSVYEPRRDPYRDMRIGEPVRMRDGSVFRTLSDPTVYVVSGGYARAIPDWRLFQAAGYRSEAVLVVGDGTEDEVTRGIGSPLTTAEFQQCANGVRERSAQDCAYCDAYTPVDRGGGGDCPDADADGYLDAACGGRDCDDADPASWPDAAERCDGRDNDCDLLVDEPFDLASDDLNCGRCGNACSGDAHCVSGICIAGGCTADAQCGDRDDCIHDWCDASHRCQHRPLDERCPSGQYCHPTSGCMPHGYCTADEHCTYDVACTADRCVGTSCVHTPDDSRCDALHSCTAAYGCQLRDTDGDGITDIGDCAPTDPSRALRDPETCNGLDDDCDGIVDEDFDFLSDSAHCGRCGNVCTSGRYCSGGVCVASCVPSTEWCNDRDDDCDGRVDEGLTRTCTDICGTGIETCSSGVWHGCTARPSVEACDGLDNDCDGVVDDGFSLLTDPRNCGACRRICAPGESCVGGVCRSASVDAGRDAGVDGGVGTLPCSSIREVCDGIDNDCDGTIDEGFPSWSCYSAPD